MVKRIATYLLIFMLTGAGAAAQQREDVQSQPGGELLALTLEETIERARRNSPDAREARHTLRSAYWTWRHYRADNLPALTLTSYPSLDRAINQVLQDDGSVKFIEQNILSTDLALQITQNVPWLGGTFFIETALARLDMLSDKTHSWQSSPINIGYRQSIFGYNSFKWNNRIEPLRYREARESYIETMELVAVSAVEKFFNLARAQSDYLMAQGNYEQADTLYMYARGRYELGTISENEMLQLEINLLTEENNMMNALTQMDKYTQELKTYLGIQDGAELHVQVEESVPDIRVDLDDALFLANAHSPEIRQMQRKKLESESAVAYAKSNAGLKADIYLRFGLTQTAEGISAAYRNPTDQQSVSLGIVLPILDWGKGKGQVQVAKSNMDLVSTQIEQQRADFTLNVTTVVNQFNLQAQRVDIAARTDAAAQRRAEVARQLYISGQSSVLDLNASISEKDMARQRYLDTIRDWWSLYYMIRSITLYDFERQEVLVDDVEELR